MKASEWIQNRAEEILNESYPDSHPPVSYLEKRIEAQGYLIQAIQDYFDTMPHPPQL